MNKIFSIVEGDLNKVRQALKAVNLANNCKSKLTALDIRVCEAMDILDMTAGPDKPEVKKAVPCPRCGLDMVHNTHKYVCVSVFCDYVEPDH